MNDQTPNPDSQSQQPPLQPAGPQTVGDPASGGQKGAKLAGVVTIMVVILLFFVALALMHPAGAREGVSASVENLYRRGPNLFGNIVVKNNGSNFIKLVVVEVEARSEGQIQLGGRRIATGGKERTIERFVNLSPGQRGVTRDVCLMVGYSAAGGVTSASCSCRIKKLEIGTEQQGEHGRGMRRDAGTNLAVAPGNMDAAAQPLTLPDPTAATPDAEEEFRLGTAYAIGDGRQQDQAKANELLERAARHGSIAAQTAMGIRLWRGIGNPPDKVEAAKWLTHAAQFGDESAKAILLEIGGSKPASPDPLAPTKSVAVGSFSVNVPTDWAAFTPEEAAALRSQYLEQSRQIYQQFSGASDDPAKSVDVAAFHILRDDGSFAMVSFTVPPQADLIALLKSQVAEKMDWGVRNGHIRKYLGLVPIDDENLSGFYIKTIGKNGNMEVSGGLEHKKLKSTIIQLTLLSPKTWDEPRATNSLATVLNTVTLKRQ